MCRRFTTAMVNMTGSSDVVGFEAAGQRIAMVPGGVPHQTAPPVAIWQIAPIGAELADVTATGATDEAYFSVLTLGDETR